MATEWIEGADTPNRFDKSQSSRYLAALPYSDSAAVSALDTVLQERWEPTVAKEGVAFIPAVGTLSQMTALGEASHLLCLVGVSKSADFSLPLTLESTAEETLATPLSAIWRLAEAVKKTPVAEVGDGTQLACGYDKPCTRRNGLSDTQHSLADGEGKEAFGQVGGEDLARVGKAIGQADTSLEEVLQACILHSLLMAEEEPADFKEFAEVVNPMNHIFVKPAREGVAVYNPFTSKHFLLQGERVPKTDTIADLLAKGALVACEPPEKTKKKADDNRFQFPWGLPGQSVEFDASQAGASTQKRRMLVVAAERSRRQRNGKTKKGQEKGR